MKILITGNLGFVGHHITKELYNRGHKVIGIDRVSNPVSDKQERIDLQKAWSIEQQDIDLADISLVLSVVELTKPDTIVHCAAQYSVSYTTENCIRYVENNLAAHTYICEACKVFDVPKMIFVSSSAVSTTQTPSGIYGATKSYGEQCCHAYASRSKTKYVSVRLGPVYGPYSRMDAAPCVLLQQYLKSEQIKKTKMFASHHPYIYSEDAGKIFSHLASMDPRLLPKRPMILEVSANETHKSHVDILLAAQKAVGLPINLPDNFDLHKYKESDNKTDMESLHAVTKYIPETRMEVGVPKMLEWLKRAMG